MSEPDFVTMMQAGLPPAAECAECQGGHAVHEMVSIDGMLYCRFCAYGVQDVKIPSRDAHEGFYFAWVRLYWGCPVCGGPRGQIHQAASYDGSMRLIVDGWENACGHVDKYADVLLEAAQNGLNAKPASGG